MVSLSLLKLLEDNGFGTIDNGLYWQKMGIDGEGLYIADLGGSQDRNRRTSITYSIYSRAESDVQAYQQLEAVVEFLNSSFAVCKLPAVPPTTNYGYDNVTIMPPSAITNAGQDANGRTIYSITGQLYYGDKVIVKPPTQGLLLLTESSKVLLTENNKEITTEEK